MNKKELIETVSSKAEITKKEAELIVTTTLDSIIEGLTKEFGLTVDEIEKFKAQKKSWWNEFNNYYKTRNTTTLPMEAETVLTNETMMETEKRILQNLAAHESCVVAGRSGFLVFREWPNHISIFIQAPLEKRIERLRRKKGIDREEAIGIIEKVDKARETFIQKYAKTSRYDTRNYDIVLNMDGLTEDEAVDIIMAYIDRNKKA